LAIIIVSATGLFNGVIDHYMDKDQSESFDQISAVALYTGTLFEDVALYIAAIIVAVPGFLLLYTRSRKAERLHAGLTESRARRRLDYVWLAIVGLFVIGTLVAFVYSSLMALLGEGSTTANESWLESTLKQAFSLVFMLTAATLVARQTPGLPQTEVER
jgi:ABC-type Fe3+ transport system permease subunit